MMDDYETVPHKKRRGGKKPFGIMYRFTRPKASAWFRGKRYPTAEKRNQALEMLRKHKSTIFGKPFMAFKAVDY